jgi:hypothetical protein
MMTARQFKLWSVPEEERPEIELPIGSHTGYGV